MGLTRETLAARVRAAVAASGRHQREIAAAIDLDPTALSKAISGRRDFKSLEIALLAEELGLRTDDLLADEDVQPRPPAAVAARMQVGANPAVEQALRYTEELLDLDALLTELGQPTKPSTVAWPTANASLSPAVQGKTLAGALRKRLGLDHQDLPYDLDDLAALLEHSLAVDIAFRPLPDGLDGLAVSSGDFRLAVVSSGIFATRQRFTLAHEIGHLLAGDADELTVDEDVLGGNTDQERRANAFAAAFLLPERALKAAVPSGKLTEPEVAELLGRFGVSRDALAIELHRLRLVSTEEHDRIRTMASARLTSRPGRTTDLQARDRTRVPGTLLERATTAYASGELGVRPLAQLLGKHPDRLLDELTPPRESADGEAAVHL
ncbi:ImmA/IrrE family metallo-endopeptidase [Micromonospora sp. NPDC049523]|uniref:ImmA/IrrE family metallo-endopeptidase n=1 Tax=Micromonospora sp. NPDC049523 TaxID=3155921 RepID=UPI0034437AA0